MITELSENFYVILFAYLVVFLPWTFVTAADFISPTWKTVRQTRRDGIFQLFFLTIPPLYIVFYIYLQFSSQDYKEAFAAIAALIYSLLYLLRTLWALAQLYEFRIWAAHSSHACNALHIPFRLERDGQNYDEDSPWQMADFLLVNNTIIDNHILNGDSCCYLQYGHHRPTILEGQQRCISAAALLLIRLKSLVQLTLLPLRWLLDRMSCFLLRSKTPLPFFRLAPRQPIDLWLNWAVVFAAQGLSESMPLLAVAEDPDDQLEEYERDPNRLFEARRAYFAKEVLSSAALHLQLGELSSLLLWDEWAEDSSMADGRVSKQELLKLCFQSGDGLPMNVPHTVAVEQENGTQNRESHAVSSRVGYKAYAIKLKRITESVPASFGDAILQFDIPKLEWLAVVLFLGARVKKRYELGKHPATVLNQPSTRGWYKNSEHQDLENDDLAFTSLRAQLGFSRSEGQVTDLGILNLVAFPLREDILTTVSERNRLVLKVGDLIDTWLALIAGEQLSYLITVDESWAPTLECTEESNNVWKIQFDLETARLEYQFARSLQRYFHLDQSLTFIGYDMEFVRSELANWVQNHPGVGMDVWEPSILNAASSDLHRPESSYRGYLSKDLITELMRAQDRSILSKRSFQVRMLSELRNILQHCATEKPSGPSSALLIILCLLAFPALRVFWDSEGEITTCQLGSSPGSSRDHLLHSNAEMSEVKQNAEHMINTWELTVSPAFGPQNLLVSVSLFAVTHELARATISLVCNDSSGCDMFLWNKWRDSYLARLEAHRQWQDLHRMRSTVVYRTFPDLSLPIQRILVPPRGTGMYLTTWGGWLPFRFGLCRFELESPGFIGQYVKRRDLQFQYMSGFDFEERQARIAQEDLVSVSYREAQRENLQHACFVASEVLDEHLKGKSAVGDDSVEGQRIVQQAKDLLSQGAQNVERALFLLEVASVELNSLEALRMIVDMVSADVDIDLRRAVKVLERFVGKRLGFVPGRTTLSVSDKLQGQAVDIHYIYLSLVESHGYDVAVISSFTRWILMIQSCDLGLDYQELQACIRRSFIRNRSASVIFRLGSVARPNLKVEEMSTTGTDRPNDLSVSDRLHGIGINRRQGVLRNAIFRRAVADGNNVDAMLSLGVILHKGQGHPKDAMGAVRFYERAIAVGEDTDAMTNLGVLLFAGADGVARDVKKAFQLFEKAVELGNAIAMNNLATLLRHGAPGIPSDTERSARLAERAINEERSVPAMVSLAITLKASGRPCTERIIGLYERAIMEGNSTAAMNNLGMILQHGTEDVKRDGKRAVELFERAIESGSSHAAYNLACLLRDGCDGVDKDLDSSASLFQHAITYGQDADAMNNLGLMYREGNGVSKSDTKAQELFEMAISMGQNIAAMVNLGNLLRDGGSGVSKDCRAAAKLFEAAFTQEDVDVITNEEYTSAHERTLKSKQHKALALRKLAILLLDGRKDVEKDVKRATELLEQAIECHDDATSMRLLADVLMKGSDEIPKDERRAAMLLERGVNEKGYVGCMEDLACLLRNGRDHVPPNPSRAADLFQKAVDSGAGVVAVTNLARMYFCGWEGFEPDKKKAAELFEQAVTLGCGASDVDILAGMYYQGTGVDKDMKRAAELYESSIRKERSSHAIAVLAGMLLYGNGIEPNRSRAVALYEAAIAEGHEVQAMFGLGVVLRYGVAGVEKDVERAVSLLEQAILEGNNIQSMELLYQLFREEPDVAERHPGLRAELRRKLTELGKVVEDEEQLIIEDSN